MAYGISMVALISGLVVCCLKTDAAADVKVSASSDLYSESPCELHPLSAYKDSQGNIWGVGEGNLWWFNATNLSWSLLPFPNGTASSEPWRVACGDPRKYIAVVGKNATLVLHLPWQHWQNVDTDDVSLGYVDKDATWCVDSQLFGIDPLRETLYLLDAEEAHWTVRQDLPVMNNVNWSTPVGVVNTWVGVDDELIIVERFGDYRHIMYTNTTGISWVVMSEYTFGKLWPNLDDSAPSLAWRLKSSNRMWLWKDVQGSPELWAFEYNSTGWEKGNEKIKLPSRTDVLTAWVDGDSRYCILSRSRICTAQYSTSVIECWSEDDMIAPLTVLETTPQSTTQFMSSTAAQEKTTNSRTSSSVVITPPVTSLQEPPSSAATDTLAQPAVTKHTPKTSWAEPKTADRDTNFVITVTRTESEWHQRSTVFGSLIFFGTSLTIFGLVGVFWCVRKCVHFPKEALLLRDPPSVRYTAIPDSLGYDSRKPTPATYTVIPDAIA